MTVKTLIEKLKEFDQDLEVQIADRDDVPFDIDDVWQDRSNEWNNKVIIR